MLAVKSYYKHLFSHFTDLQVTNYTQATDYTPVSADSLYMTRHDRFIILVACNGQISLMLFGFTFFL